LIFDTAIPLTADFAEIHGPLSIRVT